MPAPDRLTTISTASVGISLSRSWLFYSAAGVTFDQRSDSAIGWSTEATAAAINYAAGGLSVGASFSLLSPSGQALPAMPTLPAVGLSLRYTLGNAMAALPPELAPPRPAGP
jgi:hypothetical protein